MRTWQHLILIATIMLVAPASYADKEAMDLLERMGNAAKTLNYDGTFFYQSGRNLQSIRIVHRSDNQGEIERVVSLNGAAREVIRTNDLVTCIYPEGKQVHVNRRPLGKGFPSDFLRRLNSATPYYTISLGSKKRIAGRHAQELVISPVDDYRYGYRLWVDKENDLLLKSELVSSNGNVLEAFEFSSIDFDKPITDEMLRPEVSGQKMKWNRGDLFPSKQTSAVTNLSMWKVGWLPEGFVLVAQQNRLKAMTGNAVEQRVYSDGLSSISIFIEQIHAAHQHLKGISNMGALNAFGTIMNSHFLTVVGEVPSQTVDKLGNSIYYGKPNK